MENLKLQVMKMTQGSLKAFSELVIVLKTQRSFLILWQDFIIQLNQHIA
jgi:hypothetical protein